MFGVSGPILFLKVVDFAEYGFQEVVSSESVALINHLSQMYARYKRFNVNPAEFACMKAIVLFKSGKPDSIPFIVPPHIVAIFRLIGISSPFCRFVDSSFRTVLLGCPPPLLFDRNARAFSFFSFFLSAPPSLSLPRISARNI